MILRKPYALLIKYFQKIHLVLLLLAAYLFYKTMMLRDFVKEFVLSQSYNRYLEPISQYISFPVFLSLFLIIFITIILMILLHHKKKPWRSYLFVLTTYLFLGIVLLYIRNYFVNYDEYSTLISIMAGRDLLLLAYIPQYIVFVILGIRFLGIDLKKFGFYQDEEYLEIKEADREEFEVNIEFDKDKWKRGLKKRLRHLHYLYIEHKFLCQVSFCLILLVVVGGSYYYFGVENKMYQEGDRIEANGYQIKVLESYITNKDTRGDDLSDWYVVAKVQVKNLGNARVMNLDRFRLMYKNQESKNTKQDSDYFLDIGNPYDERKIGHLKDTTFTLTFPVKKALKDSTFVLYYQVVDDNLSIKKLVLQPIKSAVVTEKIVNEQEELVFPSDDTLTIMSHSIGNTINYSSYKCYTTCSIYSTNMTTTLPTLTLSFISDSFDGSSFIDFLNRYAKINYKNQEGNLESMSATNVLKEAYLGNVVYLKLNSDINVNDKIDLVFTFRNKRYIYHIQ